MRTHEQLKTARPEIRMPQRAWRPTTRPPGLDEAIAVFAEHRPRIFGIAYRMLGSVIDAEDLVQEVWIRWQRTDRDAVREPAAFLATTATRLAINALQSARARREAYVGPWLPEPIDTDANPEVLSERGDDLGFAFLLLLERLSPRERAAYVLRIAFDYPYARIAEILDSNETSVRKLVSRATAHLDDERHAPVPAGRQRLLLDAFLDAARSGDLAALESLLTEDVVSLSDGGGHAQAARFPLVGRERVAKFVHAVSEWFWNDVDLTPVQANGQPAMLLSAFGAPFAVIAVNVTSDGIDRVFWMVNAEKIGAVVDAVGE
ncbi:RNA polymerase sigma-70 factor [Agromyces larvae]|uniref:RNA polymerase sigma-70 factor n=1 Tax=Agromyces larvae TaxID=2929802 RepID=A0ABY4BY12_9MICO|nr:RNA polymerase sigma-70 factor [Agromyces larvae]UOE44112.1 RNA polymerase sigma-70 factor [Agromyces larvae]